MPNQATSDAKKTMSPTPAAQAHSCSTSWALRPTPSSNLGCHGSWNHWPWESWWCCYMLISAVCLPCAARCSICIILPQAYPILWTIFLYLLVVPPEKRGYWVLLFSRINVTSVRPSGSQHGNVHHKLQYISAHLGPLFRTYDLKLSRSHQWRPTTRPTTSGCSVGHRCGSTSIPCLQIEKGWEGVDLKTFRIWRPSFETNEVHMGPESKHVQTHGIHWNPILFTRKSLGFMDVHPLNKQASSFDPFPYVLHGRCIDAFNICQILRWNYGGKFPSHAFVPVHPTWRQWFVWFAQVRKMATRLILAI